MNQREREGGEAAGGKEGHRGLQELEELEHQCTKLLVKSTQYTLTESRGKRCVTQSTKKGRSSWWLEAGSAERGDLSCPEAPEGHPNLSMPGPQRHGGSQRLGGPERLGGLCGAWTGSPELHANVVTSCIFLERRLLSFLP